MGFLWMFRGAETGWMRFNFWIDVFHLTNYVKDWSDLKAGHVVVRKLFCKVDIRKQNTKKLGVIDSINSQ